MANTPPQWPGIDQPFAHKDLGGHLFYVAALHARRALTGATGDLAILDRAISLGTSIELLAKSALSHINPAFVAADRESKNLLHFSGISTVDEPAQTKTRMVGDCLTMLHQMYPSLDYKFDRDRHAFDVRNLAAHLGCVDAAKLEDALTTMVALSEQVLSILNGLDASLDRSAYWSSDFLEQVDERLKAQAEARKLALQQLKAAAQLEIERLRSRGLEDDMLVELANHPPPAYYEFSGTELDARFERQECPVCGFEGWLEYSVHRSNLQYESNDDNPPIIWVDVEYEPSEFYCNVCSLRLGDDLVYIEQMGEYRTEEDEATQAEIDAAEEAAIERYWEERRDVERYGVPYGDGDDEPDRPDEEPEPF